MLHSLQGKVPFSGTPTLTTWLNNTPSWGQAAGDSSVGRALRRGVQLLPARAEPTRPETGLAMPAEPGSALPQGNGSLEVRREEGSSWESHGGCVQGAQRQRSHPGAASSDCSPAEPHPPGLLSAS